MIKKTYRKIVDESYAIPKKHGGGLVKSEVWVDSKGKVVKYTLAYINPDIFSGDNGRVLGYDNAHAFHHKHYKGDISPVDDFRGYEDVVVRFEQELKEFIYDDDD